jgi:Sec-independent protein translocase protein TatA
VFDLSIEKLLILAVVALFVLGPEKLPTAATLVSPNPPTNQKLRQRRQPENPQRNRARIRRDTCAAK